MRIEPDEEEVRLAKAAMRPLAKARRDLALGAGRPIVSRRIAAFGLDALRTPQGSVVSLFMGMADEIDTEPLARWLAAEGFRLAMPVMQGKAHPLLFRAWAPGDEMDEAQWGIREPKLDRPELVPAVVIVPLLAFDREGWRLGYGGGYYDRTLRSLRREGSVTAVGLALDELEVDAVPHLDYDERLDWVLTQSGPRRLGGT